MSKTIIIILLSLIICFCSSHKSGQIPENISSLKKVTVIPANTKLVYQISFKKDAVYGESKDVLIGRIWDIAVDDSGKVFIFDDQKMTLDVFKPNGHYLTHLGREGRGPGEFSGPRSITILLNKLNVYDYSLHRVDVFSTDSLALIRTINIVNEHNPTKKMLAGYGLDVVIPRSDGMFIAKFIPFNYPRHTGYNPEKYNQKYYLMSTNGKVIPGEILEQKGFGVGFLLVNIGDKVGGRAFAFMPHSLIALSGDGHFYTAWNKEFLIKEYNPQGDYLRAVYSPYNNVSLVEDSLLNDYKGDEYSQSIIKNAKLPKTWPALNEIKLDDQNRLWISTIVKNMKVYQWWILTQKGKVLARFNWPRSKPIEVIKNGYMYTQETDTTTGVSKIVRYRITMKPAGNNNP